MHRPLPQLDLPRVSLGGLAVGLVRQISLGRAIMSGAVNLASDERSLSSHPEGQDQRERTKVL